MARLEEAGAVIIGKTTTPEFGWKAFGDSPLTGITRNPWDLRARPAAAAPARRRPAPPGSGRCISAATAPVRSASRRLSRGVFGLKPSFGRVPAYPPSPMGLLSHHRADGPQRRATRRRCSTCCRAARPPRPLCAAAAGRRLCARARRRRARLADRLQPRPRLRARSIPRSPPQSPRRRGSSRRSARIVEQVGAIFDSPREALFTLWARGRGAHRRRLSRREARS